MGGSASSGIPAAHASKSPSRSDVQATLLVNGSVKRGTKGLLKHPMPNVDAGIDMAAIHKIDQRRRKGDTTHDEEMRAMMRDGDPATLHILNSVRDADNLPDRNSDLKLQLLRECHPYLEQVPAYRFDHLAVLLYQKEGDAYLTEGDTENANAAYSRAIQIAETRVARGEKGIYMVLKRYVLSMVGMARLWYEKERETTGFMFAGTDSPAAISLEDSMRSIVSSEASLLSDTSVFSLNQEILKSMAPRMARRHVGPTVNVVKLLRPKVNKTKFTLEDDFVLRSQMTRELKASPCELILLRCIEVVEIGHRRQSELLLPALIELAQIYEDLHLYNRSLLLVRRCLGILCVVYDYDHPWIVQLRRREDYLIEHMELHLRDDMATKIQATWKMYKAMRLLEETLGRVVTRHVKLRRPYENQESKKDFLNDFISELPDGTVLCGTGNGNEIMEAISENANELLGSSQKKEHTRTVPSPRPPLHPERGLRQNRSWPLRSADAMNDSVSPVPETEEKQGKGVISVALPEAQPAEKSAENVMLLADERIVNTEQETRTDTHLQDTEYGGLLTVRTVTVTRTVTEREIGSDEEDSDDEEHIEEEQEKGEGGMIENDGGDDSGRYGPQ